MDISVIIPVYNEEESLRELHRQLCQVAPLTASESEIIFVDDGSTDTSWSVIKALATEDPCIRGIRFRRNFGKAAALEAGFTAASKDSFRWMPTCERSGREFRFLDQMARENLDVISGWKKRRHDRGKKVFPSRIFNFMVSRLTGVLRTITIAA